MTILIIARGIPDSTNAQWGSFEFDQAKALADLGHHVIIAAVDSRFRWVNRKIGLTKRTINTITTYNLFLCPSAILKVFSARFKEAFKLWQWQKMANIIAKHEGKIDIIYTHYLFNTYYATKTLNRFNAPIVAIEHWSELNKEPLNERVLRMANYAYPKVTKLLTVSKPLQERIHQLFGIQAEVVHNMLGSEFTYAPDNTPHPFTLVCVGSLLPVKNHKLLIQALHQLQLDKPWQLLIIGEGPERSALQQQINKASLQEQIHLLGLKNKAQIAEILHHCDVFVLPSISENFSVAVLEALACGLPVIASITGGIRECIDNSNGLLFEVNDVDGLAKAINHMFLHLTEYDRQAIAENCQKQFSAPVIAQQLTTIFQQCLQ